MSKVIKAGFGYVIGNYLLKGLVFLTIPIFTRLLSPSDFGVYNTFAAYESIGTIVRVICIIQVKFHPRSLEIGFLSGFS